ncbi:MAG TPA: APC family permease [Saprospiraceae bacterium]|nr:APC family permease [Saprospiraceae bacterium]
MQQQEEGLKRAVGLWGFSANMINIIVGAGIFVLPAIIAEGLGAAAILAYLYCGFLVITIALCFAEVGSSVTQSGGSYSYIEVAFGKYAGFLATNLFVIGACITADAAVANALADSLAYLLPIFKNQVVRSIFFLFLFSGLAWLNIRGVKEGIGMVKLTAIAKLTPLLLLLLLGWMHISVENLAWTVNPTFKDLGAAALVLFFAFQGVETGMNIGGEVKSPQKTIPRGIFISVLCILVLYILIQITAQGILGPSLPTFKEAPLAETAKHVFGAAGVTIIIVGAAISIFGMLSGEILNIPRIIFRASFDDVIPPKALSRVHQKYFTPYVAIIAYATLDFLLATIGEFKQLAILSSASVLLIYLGVALSVIKLRVKKQTQPGAFRIPGGYLVPILAILTVLWLLSSLSRNEQIGGLIFVGVLTAIYFGMGFFRKKKEGV